MIDRASIIPLLTSVTYDTDAYYAWLGGGLGVLRVPFEKTDELVAALTRPAGWIVALWLLLGLGGLGFLRPRWLALLVPPLIVHLLSSQIPQQQILLQYGLLLVVPALVGAGLGGRRLLAVIARSRRRARPRRTTADATQLRARALGRRRRRAWPLALFAVPAIVAAVQAGAVPPFSNLQRGFWERPAAIDRLRAVAALAPHDAVLSVDWGLASALASQPHIEVLPFDDPGAYVIVDRQPFVTGRFPWTERAAFIAQIESSERPLLRDDGRFRLWGLPAGVVGEAIDRLPVGHALEALEDHHDRHDEGRDRAPPDIGEEVREQLVGEEVEAFPVERGMDRVRRNPRTAELGRAPEDVSLAGRGPERQGGSCDLLRAVPIRSIPGPSRRSSSPWRRPPSALLSSTSSPALAVDRRCAVVAVVVARALPRRVSQTHLIREG